tara:strand:- start:45 stop:224 length:180 start_codon:yes stop_codon:yes gene_type:complete
MNNTTFYCVWWAQDDATPESQLMGIFETQEKAEGCVASLNEYDDVYLCVEQTDEGGYCK